MTCPAGRKSSRRILSRALAAASSKVLIREGIGERFDYGGGASDLGTVFKIDPSGELTTLQSFREPDGRTPMAALIEATDGDFYGTTEGIFNFP